MTWAPRLLHCRHIAYLLAYRCEPYANNASHFANKSTQSIIMSQARRCRWCILGGFIQTDYSFTVEAVVSPPPSFSSTISIRASLYRVTDNCSLMYPTFRLTVVLKFDLLIFSADAALTKASCNISVFKFGVYYCLTCVNFPSSKVMLRKTTFIRLFCSRRGTTMNDICSSTISPSWKVWGPVSLNLFLCRSI